MKVLFHGASVTEQKDLTGYYENVVKLCENEKFSFSRCGYGGCHLEDAAFATIDKDSDGGFDICFLEWNTTGNPEFETKKLEYIVEVLLSKKVLPVFLILPRTETLRRNRTAENQVHEIALKYNIFVCDYRSQVEAEKHLRDFVHTNTAGGMLYARLIRKDLHRLSQIVKTYEFKKYDIQYHFVEQEQRIVCNEGQTLIFENVGEKDSLSEIVVEIIRGPNSPVIINSGIKESIWDQHCHYERVDYLFIKPNENGHCVIEVTRDEIDYSVCRRPFSYEGIKQLTINKIYFVNTNVNSFKVF